MSKVELISKTVGLNSYEKLDNNEIIAAIARHGTVKENGGKLVKYLMDNKHWSPLQHISFGFKIETRRSISAQIFRHRSLNGQEWSLRYAEPLGFEDIELRREHPTNRQSSNEVFDPVLDTVDYNFGEIKASDRIQKLMYDIENLYQELISQGVAKECARMILPECTTSTLTFNGSLRSWLAFLNVRCDNHAQKEIVVLATLVGEALEKEMPSVFSQIDWRQGMFM